MVLPLALLTAALALPLPARAASLTRTFVSGSGNDANPCTVTQPCRTFAAAYNATAVNGIIAALDPAGYGPLTITQAITIDGNGWAGITAQFESDAITINVNPGDKVVLRGVIVDGANNVKSGGIVFDGGGSLTVERCVVRNVLEAGLDFRSRDTAAQLAVADSSFIDTGNAIFVETAGAGALTASIDRTEFDGNNDGLLVRGFFGTGALTVAVTDSVAADNSSGFVVTSPANQSVSTLVLTNVQVAGNSNIGIEASGPNATLWLGRSTVSGNGSGFSADTSGVINTFGDNYFANNGSNTGSLTPVSQQ